jgi:hypothetical protein
VRARISAGTGPITLEYLHVEFGSQAYFNPSPAPTVNIRSDVPLTNEIVRGGLNFRF